MGFMMSFFKRSELVAICEVYKCESYSAAAKNLNLAQSNLSKLIKTIEARIGLKIFESDMRTIKVTQFGREFIHHIQNTLGEMDKMSCFVENYKRSLNGNVKVCAPTGILIYLARHILPKIREIIPEVSFQLTTHNTVPKTGITVMDNADITFTCSAPDNEYLVVKRVATTPMDIYSTEDTLLRHPVSDISDYERYPCIRMTKNAQLPSCWSLHDINKSKEIMLSVNGNYVVDNFMTGIELAKKTNHFFLAPKILVSEMNSPCLKSHLPENIQAFCSVYMVYRPKAYLPYRISVVTELISRLLEGDSLN